MVMLLLHHQALPQLLGNYDNLSLLCQFYKLIINSENDEKIRKALEDDNNKLRELLKEAQQEILNLSNSNAKPSTIANKVRMCFLIFISNPFITFPL